MVRSSMARCVSELLGTFLLVFIGCGSAVFAGAQIGWLGVSFAFGITLMALVYLLGNISGCHLNPAVTLGLVFVKRFPVRDAGEYIVSQLLGGILAGAVLYALVGGSPQIDLKEGLALTGFAEHSPTGCSMITCFLAEMISTGILVFAVLLATSSSTPAGFAGIAIGGILTVLIFMDIPITNASLNIARSLGVAVFYGGWAIQQLWLFLGSQIVGALSAAVIVKIWFSEKILSQSLE